MAGVDKLPDWRVYHLRDCLHHVKKNEGGSHRQNVVLDAEKILKGEVLQYFYL